MPYDMKARSSVLLAGRDRAAARSYLKGIGYSDEDLAKPIIGVANTWTETMNCNLGLRDLAVHVKAGIRAAGGTPMEFNTIAISDGITNGVEGMKTSLISRELIADSMELMARGHYFDAWICLGACDKTIPAAAMAASLSSAFPDPPEIMAPACPMRRPGGAVWPAIKPTTGFFT